MKELKGTKTEKNLLDAFAGESMARNKYTYFASKAKKEGYGAYILILVQMKGVKYFVPNWDTHPEFGEALREAEKNGVVILSYDSIVTPTSVDISEPVSIILS